MSPAGVNSNSPESQFEGRSAASLHRAPNCHSIWEPLWRNISFIASPSPGNAYRAALMLNLIGADWEPVWVDFFNAMVQRTPQFRSDVNEMGEAPVLVHGKRS